MLCPKCHDQVLVPVERQGVEIDYCPGCRGVWLDRGELDKVIEHSASMPPQAHDFRHVERYRTGRSRRSASQIEHEERRGKRRGRLSNFLEDLFDFE